MDRFIDLSLEEEIGRRGPPDLVQAVLGADDAVRARAARRVERATLPRRISPWTLGAMAILGLAAAAAALILVDRSLRPLERSGDHPHMEERADAVIVGPVDTTNDDPFQRLINDFHAAMPVSPGRLRSADEREYFAPDALPVLACLRAHVRDSRDVTLRGLLTEFEVYSAVLGDSQVLRDLELRSASGEADAAYALDVVALTVADSAEARAAALGAFAERIATDAPFGASLARSLVVAELQEEECERLLEVATAALGRERAMETLQPVLHSSRRDPRRFIGTEVRLDGPTVDGGFLSTIDLRGEVVVVMFWASWCGPCERMQSALADLRARSDLGHFEAVGVSCDMQRKSLVANLDQHPERDWPQLYDVRAPGWHELAFEFDVQIVPTAFVIDRGGLVVDVVHTPRELESALGAAMLR